MAIPSAFGDFKNFVVIMIINFILRYLFDDENLVCFVEASNGPENSSIIEVPFAPDSTFHYVLAHSSNAPFISWHLCSAYDLMVFGSYASVFGIRIMRSKGSLGWRPNIA